MEQWLPTRDEGLRRLERFLPSAGRAYAKMRNYDLGPGNHAHVSTLSPWIRHRLILEEEVVAAVLERHSFSAAEKFIQEVFWRTYWKGWLELRPAVWSQYRAELDRLAGALDVDPDLRRRWEAATGGRTGIDCFDAWGRELTETGYLHNHARMWFASIWIFTLELPWQLGADFFLRQLLDGDPASNTLSWRWVAGLQTRGKTYLARPDNIARYTQGRFSPANLLSPTARPREGPAPPAATAPPQPAKWRGELPSGLLLTDEDLSPEFLSNEGGQFRGLAALTATGLRSPLEVSPAVRAFTQGAMADAVDRLRDELAVPVGPAVTAEKTDAVVDWARAEGLRQVVTPYVPVGPTAAAVEVLSERLARHGIHLVPALRRWDQAAWPHATRGFFQFREKIPKILDAIRKPMAGAA